MNEQKQRIAIAEACGWIVEKVWDGSLIGKPKNEQGPMDDLPDYLHDLNAMHEAENSMTEAQRITYTDCLYDMANKYALKTGRWRYLSATAAQRAEAFLRALGKWEE